MEGETTSLTATPPLDIRSGYCDRTGVYHSRLRLGYGLQIPTSPNLDTATFLLSHFPPENSPAAAKTAIVDATTHKRLTYGNLHGSIRSLAAGLHHALGVQKGDVVLVLSPNSLYYPTICIAVLSIGAVLTTVNPLNTASELAKQVRDSGAKLAIVAPELLHKLESSGVPTVLTQPTSNSGDHLSIEELIASCEPLDWEGDTPVSTQTDTAALLYSSGTTGVSKCVILTHRNLISIITLLKWVVYVGNSQDDVFLAALPMFHIYGLAFFALGLFSVGATLVLLPRFEFTAMLDTIQAYKVTNVPAVPPIILGLVKNVPLVETHDLSSLRMVNTGAAPLSKELADAFRERFPGVELKQGYGLTESSGAATHFVSDEQARERPQSVGLLFPSFSAKIVDPETELAQPPNKLGELWLKSPTIMKGYLGNKEATAEAINAEGWLRTGDLCYFDEDGFLFVIDRIKELIKHNGYQVAPAELEAILLSHPNVQDAAVVPIPDIETGEIPMAYVVKEVGSRLTEDQLICFVSDQVAPYKKVRRVSFLEAIPRSAAGKILRKQLLIQNTLPPMSKL